MIASQAENLKFPDHLQVLFDLISEGRLPPADGFSIHSSDPTWNLASIAKLIGVSRRSATDSAPEFFSAEILP